MKNPMRPQRRQKELMMRKGLKWENWLVYGEDSEKLYIISKNSSRKITLKK